MTIDAMTATRNYAAKILYFLNDMKKNQRTETDTIKKLRYLLRNDITWYDEAIDQQIDAMYANSKEVRDNVRF